MLTVLKGVGHTLTVTLPRWDFLRNCQLSVCSQCFPSSCLVCLIELSRVPRCFCCGASSALSIIRMTPVFMLLNVEDSGFSARNILWNWIVPKSFSLFWKYKKNKMRECVDFPLCIIRVRLDNAKIKLWKVLLTGSDLELYILSRVYYRSYYTYNFRHSIKLHWSLQSPN